MGEIATLVLLTGIGLLLLMPISHRLPSIAIGALAFPVGASAFAFGAAVQVAVIERVAPGPLLTATALVAAMIGASSVLTRGIETTFVRTAGVTLGLAAALASVFWNLHLTRLTIDSMRYILASVDLQLPSGITEVHPPDLVKRQLALPAWQTLSEFTSRRYVAGLGPLFGASGAVFLGWFVWSHSGGGRRRILLTAGAILFVLTSNRLLYDWFYINTHISVAVLMLITIVGLWLCVVEDEPAWAIPAGFALGATLLLRSESPLLVALVMVGFAAWVPRRSSRLWASLPSLAAIAIWHGWTLIRHAPDGTAVGLDAPVTTGIVVVLVASVLMIVGPRPATTLAERLVLPGMALALLVYSLLDPALLLETVGVTAVNVGYEGLWMFAWTVAIPLTALALLVQRIPVSRPWVTFTVGFGLLYLLLPFGRDAAYRLGAGDSGNRILAHAFLVVVAFLVLTATEGTDGGRDTVTR